MKVFVILLLTIVAAALAADIEFPATLYPSDLIDDTFIDPDSKISGGKKVKKGENIEFGFAIISFINKVTTCGVTLVDAEYAVTSARCCVDQQEGLATNASVTFPQFNKKPIIGVSFIVPDGSNGADGAMEATLEAYDNTTDIPFNVIGPNNVCMIKLKTKFTTKQIDGKKLGIAKYISSTDWATFMTTYLTPSAGYTLRVAGVGIIDNNGKQSKDTLVTAFQKIEDNVACEETIDGTTVTMPATETDFGACAYNPNSDANVCKFDYGGGIFAVKLDEKGAQIKGSSAEFACILVGSPNIRANAQCLGGHKNVCILVMGKVQEWIKGVIAGRKTAAEAEA